jgi:hypothetical protein
MEQEQPKWELSDDRKTLTVKFPTTPPCAFQLAVDEVERLLKTLADARGVMDPPVPADFALGQQFTAVQNPRWATEPDRLMGNSVIHVRDPRLGWLHYWIPREEARKLVAVLETQVNAPPPKQLSDKPQ